ncbi:hypothetical protein [Nocardioides caldifontis]|uniref:hypothetical protein n=1 Tax=Nocardioides caldifontis TaxID=2588938 RepID=UPI0011DF0628|nr:hypothetical protein [Nocardioides caldifontis]
MTMLPHLMHAVRTRKPHGSAFAWLVGAVASTTWFVYGLGIGDLLVAAPGFVTVPIGFFLAAWAAREERRLEELPLAVVPEQAASSVVFLPDWDLSRASAGDTLEMPRIVA